LFSAAFLFRNWQQTKALWRLLIGHAIIQTPDLLIFDSKSHVLAWPTSWLPVFIQVTRVNSHNGFALYDSTIDIILVAIVIIINILSILSTI